MSLQNHFVFTVTVAVVLAGILTSHVRGGEYEIGRRLEGAKAAKATTEGDPDCPFRVTIHLEETELKFGLEEPSALVTLTNISKEPQLVWAPGLSVGLSLEEPPPPRPDSDTPLFLPGSCVRVIGGTLRGHWQRTASWDETDYLVLYPGEFFGIESEKSVSGPGKLYWSARYSNHMPKKRNGFSAWTGKSDLVKAKAVKLRLVYEYRKRLLNTLTENGDPAEREKAIEGLRHYRDGKTVFGLLMAMEDDEALSVRHKAARQLQEFSYKKLGVPDDPEAFQKGDSAAKVKTWGLEFLGISELPANDGKESQ